MDDIFRCPGCDTIIRVSGKWKNPKGSKITHKQRKAYELVYIRKLTEQEAGVKLGISQAAVSQRLITLKKNHPEMFD
ncbi:MAG: sigma factor-like helix-turn-helix DNA-binding protein [Planctomycetota bacterium]|jgi:DNA-directed RNA polymerase specialized sigma subunit